MRGKQRLELVASCVDLVTMSEREFTALFYGSEPEDIAMLIPGIDTDVFFDACGASKQAKRAYLLGWISGVSYHDTNIIGGRLAKRVRV